MSRRSSCSGSLPSGPLIQARYKGFRERHWRATPRSKPRQRLNPGEAAMALATAAPAQHREPPPPFFREAGQGPGVVCLHANASASGQWRNLMELLAPSFHVFAPDLFDAGRSPCWPSEHLIRLQDEVDLIEPVLDLAGTPFALVGHSY